ncbi:MAG TPA: hypothetical protein VLA09_10555, partial [Longimicrobiales bacterium]|nr:hypothetical protein [Longimicrobiales bacterium]
MKLRSWRGFVGVLSFAVCASTVFLALHGLAHLFIKQRAKAFAIFGAELLGLGIFVFTVRGAFSGFLGPVGGVLQNTYLTVGLLLFGGTYLYDVSVVLFGTIVFGERVRAKERRAAIYPRVLGNRVAAQVAFAGLQSGRAGEARRVRKVFTRFGDSIDPQQLIHLLEAADKSVEPVVTRSLVRARDDEAVRELVARWGSADESLRRKIFRVLCRRPTQRSVDGLRQLRGHLGPLRKVRAWVSYAYLPLRAVPRPVVLGILLVAPVATAFLYDGFMTYQNPARPLVNFLRTPLRPFGRSDEVLRRARTVEFLGSAFRDEVADELRGLLEGGGYSDYPTVQAELVEALALQYSQNPSLEPSPELTDLLVEHAGILSDVLTGGGEPEQFQAALDALATLATVGDSVLAEQAIQGLLSYLAAETPCCEGKQATDAINALSNLPRERALTALRLAPIDLRDELGKFFADEVLVSILTTDGRSLSIGDSATGSLDSNAARGPDDRRGQAWGLEGRSGDEVAIVMESEDFDPYLDLAGPGLAEVQRDDDSAGDLDARIQLTLPEDGRYTIVAAAYRGGSGGYALRVERLEGLTLPA